MDQELPGKSIKTALSGFELSRWTDFPDIELYMDQVITLFAQQLAPFLEEGEGNALTPFIINNYVKKGVVPHPVKKKYSRQQFAALTMACVLKRVLPIQDIIRLTAPNKKFVDMDDYEAFRVDFSKILEEELSSLEQMQDQHDIMRLAGWFALRASVDDLIAQKLFSKCKDHVSDK